MNISPAPRVIYVPVVYGPNRATGKGEGPLVYAEDVQAVLELQDALKRCGQAAEVEATPQWIAMLTAQILDVYHQHFNGCDKEGTVGAISEASLPDRTTLLIAHPRTLARLRSGAASSEWPRKAA